MSSDRPGSSPPPTSSESAPARSDPIVGLDSFVPNVLDFVFPIYRAKDAADVYIPPAFLRDEAVDSSLLLGQGASFTVTRQPLPPGPERVEARPIEAGGLLMVPSAAAQPRPRYVVYKLARVSFQANGDPTTPKDCRALQSVLTELHALLHPPLLKHPNVINLLDLAWGSHHQHFMHRLPVLVVEYGDRGTLADVQLRGPRLSNRLKLRLCLGIARGLEVLHGHGIVHGDVKPDNIIMFSHPELQLVPKLADFGFSVIEADHSRDVVMGGTRLWRAPEALSSVPASQLSLTDVYSFGLLAWSVAIDGQDPFSLMLADSLLDHERSAAMQQLKENDQVLHMSKPENWMAVWSLREQAKPSAGSPPARASPQTAGPGPDAASASTGSSKLRGSALWPTEPPTSSCDLPDLDQHAFLERLEALFPHTLTRDANGRNLSAVVGLLEVSAESRTEAGALPLPDISIPSTDWARRGFKAHIYSWQQIRGLEPGVQTSVVNTLVHRDDDDALYFTLAACFINGYGVPVDVDRGLELIARTARRGFSVSRAYLHRMFASCHREVPADLPMETYLDRQAINGSRTALADLRVLKPDRAKEIDVVRRYGLGGVGSPWYCDDSWFYGLKQSVVMTQSFSLDSLRTGTQLQLAVVNKRGDHLIHAAAAVGALKLVEKLLKEEKWDVNQKNAAGDTALLCVCRSGHMEIVQLLLDSGASASIQSANGESPLHWLASFDQDEVDVETLAKQLVERGGASVDANTTQPISHSAFHSLIDVDYRLPGTPLLWAVHGDRPDMVSCLLTLGADPNWRFDEAGKSPIEWAAALHHTECLAVIMAYLEQWALGITGGQEYRNAFAYGRLIGSALHTSDRFSMILRHGPGYLGRLEATLRLLQEKTKTVTFVSGHFTGTLLHEAACKAHDDACQIILDLGWRVDEINWPAGPGSRTPLLESVRWNRRDLFGLLVRHGASVHHLSESPFDETGERTWSALHVFADQGHDEHLGLVDDLVAAGLPVDSPSMAVETPLHLAIRRNAFRLADRLRRHGADADALVTRSAMLVSLHPLTGLGHAIALNAGTGLRALRYLLGLGPSFIVEPARQLSALHLCALVPDGFIYAEHGGSTSLRRSDFDFETNRIITGELLERFRHPAQLHLPCLVGGKTALHLAAEFGNAGVVEKLVRAGADKSLTCAAGETAEGIATRLWGSSPDLMRQILLWLA